MHSTRQCTHVNFHVRTLKTDELINAMTFKIKTANSKHKACTIVTCNTEAFNSLDASLHSHWFFLTGVIYKPIRFAFMEKLQYVKI